MIGKKKEDSIVPGSSRMDAGSEITRRDPFGLWADVDRLFNSFRSGFDDIFWQPSMSHLMPSVRVPPMDVENLEKEYRITMDVPGIRKEDLEIEVGPNTIDISACTTSETEDKDKNYLRRERNSAQLHRSLEFPEELVADKVDAKVENGVLELILPKKDPQATQKRKVQVK